jgi:uncharacterized protein (TIGR03437 family)
MKNLLFWFAVLTPVMASTLSNFPLRFEERGPDKGQFLSRGPGYAIRLHATGADLWAGDAQIAVSFDGANRHATAQPLGELETRSNYLIGRDPSKWRRNLRNYSRVRYTGVYCGINIEYYGNERNLEYDFIVSPGADPRAIRMNFTAAKIDAEGNLALAGGVLWRKPVAYQTGAGGREYVKTDFVELGRNRIGFQTAAYDRSRPLIIDPVLQYTAYLGGSSADEANAIAADAAGNSYVTGFTRSIDFPSKPGAFQALTQGSQDAFVAKISPNGSSLIYATFLGGNGTDTGLGIAVDPQGNAYVTGRTESTNFPLSPGAFQAVLNGGSGIGDAFAVKLDSTGSKLVYSTYLGGSLDDQGNAIAVDKDGNAFIAGQTLSLNFPTVSPVAPARGGGDAFVCKLSPDGAKLIYSTNLGGFARDVANGIAVDSGGAAFVTGETRSDNFPVTANAFQRTINGVSDAFVTKLSADGTVMLYSTYFGGESTEDARAIAVDSTGTAWITGRTGSAQLPILGSALQRAANFLPDAYVAGIGASGQFLRFSSYLGGEGDDAGNAIAIDAFDNIIVAGQTNSVGFPVSSGVAGAVFGDTTFPATNAGGYDGFITKFNGNGAAPIYSTCIGGKGNDYIRGIALDAAGNAYVAGATAPADLRATGSFQSAPGGATDGFVARISEISLTISPASVNLSANQTQQFSATVLNASNTAVVWTINPAVGTISNNGLYQAPVSAPTAVNVIVTATSVADSSKSASASITVGPPISVTIAPAAVTLGAGQSQQFTASVANATNILVNWTTTPQIGVISGAGLYTAPTAISARTTITLTATSVADNTKSGTALITLQPPVQAAIAVAPATVSMTAGEKQQFSATVTGLATAAVAWSIAPQVGTVDATGLYTAPYPITSAQTVTVTARSTADGSVAGNATISLTASGARISAEGVTNAASFQSAGTIGGVSPGLIVTLFGVEIGPAQGAGVQLTPAGAVDTITGGVRVLFDGIAAPMIYASAGQVSCVAPYVLAGKTATQIQVEYNGQRSNAVTVPVQAASPAIFTADASGKGQGAILNQDNSVNSPANAAAAGSIVVIYATGAGQTNPDGVDGRVAGTPLPLPRLPVTVAIGGADAEILYAGAAPGLVAGVLQVNARVPAGLVAGTPATVKITVGGVSTVAAVTVSVK